MQAHIHLLRHRLQQGYTLNSTPIPVVISATYNENGTLNSYTIIVAGEATSTYTATYKTSTTAAPEIDTVTGDSSEYEIKNTKLSALPSTGGIGTTIFTIGGVIIMIGAAFLFFRNRKRSLSISFNDSKISQQTLMYQIRVRGGYRPGFI